MERTPDGWRTIDDDPEAIDGGPRRATETDGSSSRSMRSAALLAALALAGLVVGGLLLTVASPRPAIELPHGDAIQPAGTADPFGSPGPSAGASILVDVAGAVRTPGVYRLPPGARVADAIAAAGGFGPSVDAEAVTDRLNLAAPVADGTKIVVPARGSSEAGSGDVGATGGAGEPGTPGSGTAPIDLNRATQAELETLPGIGPKTAEKIVAARKEAPFRSVQELLERRLVSSSTFERIRDLVTVQ